MVHQDAPHEIKHPVGSANVVGRLRNHALVVAQLKTQPANHQAEEQLEVVFFEAHERVAPRKRRVHADERLEQRALVLPELPARIAAHLALHRRVPVAKHARELARHARAVVAEVAEPKVDIDARVAAAKAAAVRGRVRPRERLRHREHVEGPRPCPLLRALFKREAAHLRAVKALGARVDHAVGARRALLEALPVVLDGAQRGVERAVVVEEGRVERALLRAALVHRHEDAQRARARQRDVIIVLQPRLEALARAALPRPEHAELDLVREHRAGESAHRERVGVRLDKVHDVVLPRERRRGAQVCDKAPRIVALDARREAEHDWRRKRRDAFVFRHHIRVLPRAALTRLAAVREQRREVLLLRHVKVDGARARQARPRLVVAVRVVVLGAAGVNVAEAHNNHARRVLGADPLRVL